MKEFIEILREEYAEIIKESFGQDELKLMFEIAVANALVKLLEKGKTCPDS
jgi:hypothetical protein